MVYLLGTMFGQSLTSAIMALMTACLLPYVWTIIAKSLGGFRVADNQDPRAFLSNLSGVAYRAKCTQDNSFESLPFFVAGVLLSIYCFVPQIIVNGLAWLYVFIRLGYGAAYLLNLSTLRSILWALSMACTMMLFVLSLRILS